VTYTGKIKMHTKFRSESLNERQHLKDLDLYGVYGRIILEWILRKQGGRVLVSLSDC